jgi:hypothetical protein
VFCSHLLVFVAFLVPLAHLLTAFAYAGPVVDVNLMAYVISLATMAFFAFSAMLMWPVYRVMHWLRGTKKPVAVAVVAETSQPVAG